jgi:flagellar L-ring protein precursor FlgH
MERPLRNSLTMQRSLVTAAILATAAQSLPAQSLYERPVTAPPSRAQAAHGAAIGNAPGSAKPAQSVNPDAPMPMQTPDGPADAMTADAKAGPAPTAVPASAAAPAPATTMRSPRRAGRTPALADISLYAIDAPAAKEFAENDLVTIIISERSKTERNQKLDSKKNYKLDASVSAWIDLLQLLEARVKPDGNGTSELPSVGASLKNDFKGDGKYNREDKLTDRIQARVVEVKPNGTLLIEARRSIKTDKEVQEVVLSGLCRSEDITDANTVQSNQMYDLSLNVQNAGEVKNVGEKGLIPRVLDTLFNF